MKPNHLPQKRLRSIWAQVPANYYDLGIAKNPLQRAWHTQKISQVLRLLPPDTKKVLDVGCSSGVLTAQITKALPQSKVTGLDSYQKAIVFARSKYPQINFIVGDAHRLPFKNNVFDLVICTETLEHLVDPAKALLEIRRVLVPRGCAIISMDSGSLLFRIIWFFWTKTRGRVWRDAHLHEFNAKILEDLIKNAGFKITKKTTSHLGMAVTFLVIPKVSRSEQRSLSLQH